MVNPQLSSMGHEKYYVVNTPKPIRGVYTSWPACKAAISRVPGARFQRVSSREAAKALLSGKRVTLVPGTYVFVDGNKVGGVGVAFVFSDKERTIVTREFSRSVYEIFSQAPLPPLESRAAVMGALKHISNIFSELAALYLAFREIPVGSRFTLVHEYAATGAWIDAGWATHNRTMEAMIEVCRRLIQERRLVPTYLHRHSHAVKLAWRKEFGKFTERADELAERGAQQYGMFQLSA